LRALCAPPARLLLPLRLIILSFHSLSVAVKLWAAHLRTGYYTETLSLMGNERFGEDNANAIFLAENIINCAGFYYLLLELPTILY